MFKNQTMQTANAANISDQTGNILRSDVCHIEEVGTFMSQWKLCMQVQVWKFVQ